MKARLFVVNKDTIINTLDSMEVSVFVPEPKGKLRWYKTLTDIISDLMQVEIGDYIFLWESGTENIYGVYRAVSLPFYRKDVGVNAIFHIKISEAYVFERPINEYDVINNPYMKNKLWNIIGKKVAGKARGSSLVTPEEMQFLIQSLIDVNDSQYEFIREYDVIEVEDEITLDYNNENNLKVPDSLYDYDYEPLRVRSGNCIRYEKAIECILNQLFRDRRNDKLAELDIVREDVMWYANYLPYGLERSEIDYMVMESVDGVVINSIDVIELQRDVIDLNHINRCLKYSKWVAESVTNGKNIVRPVIICGENSRTVNKGLKDKDIKSAIKSLPEIYGFKEIDIYTYRIDDEITFNKYEEENDE